jgi:hypothetical protein
VSLQSLPIITTAGKPVHEAGLGVLGPDAARRFHASDAREIPGCQSIRLEKGNLNGDPAESGEAHRARIAAALSSLSE